MTGGRFVRDSERRYPHLILEGFASTEAFRSPGGGGSRTVPARNRARHGHDLQRQLQALYEVVDRTNVSLDPESNLDFGIQVEFESFADVELAFESLAREQSGIELLNVRTAGGTTYATVYVPDGKLARFEQLIRDYLAERRGANNQALDHQPLIDTIRNIRAASVSALWTDDIAVFPEDPTLSIWWEIWLPVRGDREAVVNRFRAFAHGQGIRVSAAEVGFPERTIVLAFGSVNQLSRSVSLLNLVAELRKAKETADFFDSLLPNEQQEWVDHLLTRVGFPTEQGVPYICLLDTGVNRGHPLLSPAIDEQDMHTNDLGWGTNDESGHGTQMAGLALYGNLAAAVEADRRIDLRHRLESVKLLRESGDNEGDAEHHAYLTAEAISRPEISAPDRKRVFGLAITSRDHRDRGRPSAWSSMIDSLASDAANDRADPRLLVIAAGNVIDIQDWNDYPSANSTDGIHDPGQSWNAITVGAYTNLVSITEDNAEDYQPVAQAGGLSPFSTTSSTWQAQWPAKPDFVLEGGNAGRDALGAIAMASLSLLTTNHLPLERAFTTSCATSAATALAARMAANLMSYYPTLRPETIRALLVHSARWTPEMRQMYLPPDREPSKADYLRLVRHCGFGVPNLRRAARSATNSLSMVIEERLQPFKRVGSNAATLRDMQLHELPWPLHELESLGEETVEMRVTLSYFVEPNPSARGRSRYRYESHGLRFEAKRPEESIPEFRSRVNRAARDEEEGTPASGDDPNWLIGKQTRHRGSIHTDVWKGSAADLASRGVLAVYPALGWWKTRTRLERYDTAANYSLIVSIHAPEVDIDLYTPIAAQIESGIRVGV
jgi:hypothetical protein